MMKKLFIFILIVAVLAGGVVLYIKLAGKKDVSPSEVNNFEECVAAGYPVLESYPRQCRTPDSTIFTEDIGNELAKIDLIRVNNPRPNQTIQSPVLVMGEARGFWFFEADFPIKLLDEKGSILAQGIARAQGEWMTEDFVSFEATLSFEVAETQKGTLVLEKSNPSGLPENEDELYFPIILQPGEKAVNFIETGNLAKNNPGFKLEVWYLIYEKPGAPVLSVELNFDGNSICQTGETAESCLSVDLEIGARVKAEGWESNGAVLVKKLTAEEPLDQQYRTVKLYYYNPELDKDEFGNILCSRKGLVAVEREIPITQTPIQDTISLLLRGELTSEERARGITTEYPLEGLSLKAASLRDKTLTLTFEDPDNKTGGGSCRVGILWFQIEATAKQFSEVNEVRFMPEELFQP